MTTEQSVSSEEDPLLLNVIELQSHKSMHQSQCLIHVLPRHKNKPANHLPAPMPMLGVGGGRGDERRKTAEVLDPAPPLRALRWNESSIHNPPPRCGWLLTFGDGRPQTPY